MTRYIIATSITTYGTISLEIRPKSTLPIVQMVKRFMPTGGVINAASTASTMNTPNASGSTPSAFMIGNRIGTVTSIIDKDSRNIPRIRSTAMTRVNTTNAGNADSVTNRVASWGTLVSVKNSVNTLPKPISRKIITVVRAATMLPSQTFPAVREPVAKPKTSTYATARAATSVGVANPE